MDQTIRIDPLDHFRRYTGGYNITNKHYWSSTVFTGISGYMLAIIWLLGGTVCVAVLAVKLCPANKKRKSCLPAYSWCSFVAPVFLGAILTISVIAVSGVVISASSNFHSKAKLVRNMVLGAAEEATATIFNVTGAMKAMEEHIQIYDAKASYRLNLMHQKMEAEAESIQRAATKNQHLINKGLQILDISTTTLSALIIVFVLVSLISGLLHRPRLFCLTILICWLLTSLSWMFFGFYFSLGKFAGDTCSAIQEYKEDPHKSSLSAILPCEELSTNDMLYSTRAAIHDLIDQVNANISTVEEISSLQELQLICNPFSAPPSYQYRPGDCPADTCYNS